VSILKKNGEKRTFYFATVRTRLFVYVCLVLALVKTCRICTVTTVNLGDLLVNFYATVVVLVMMVR
jgi:hypothetical protein